MARNAIGLIETVGLIGAIEAADAAAKAAAVTLNKAEVTSSALVTVHIEGELGAVQAAVDAGVQACQRVGRLLSYTIIPRPDEGLDPILEEPSNLYIPQGPFCAIALPGSGAGTNPKSSPKPDKPAKTTRAAQPRTPRRKGPAPSEYDGMTVQALRRLARRRTDISMAGREIARADKQTLVRLLRDADEARDNPES